MIRIEGSLRSAGECVDICQKPPTVGIVDVRLNRLRQHGDGFDERSFVPRISVRIFLERLEDIQRNSAECVGLELARPYGLHPEQIAQTPQRDITHRALGRKFAIQEFRVVEEALDFLHIGEIEPRAQPRSVRQLPNMTCGLRDSVALAYIGLTMRPNIRPESAHESRQRKRIIFKRCEALLGAGNRWNVDSAKRVNRKKRSEYSEPESRSAADESRDALTHRRER